MKSRSFRASAFALPLMPVLLFSTAACQQIPAIRVVAIEADTMIAEGICDVWLPVSYSGRDTAETQLEVRAGNAARDAYCGGAP